MIHCQKCKTVNSSDRDKCQNCGTSLLPGRGACTRIGVLAAALAFTALAVFILVRMFQGADMPDLGCAFTSPVYWIIAAVVTPILGLAYALQRTPAHEKYTDRAKRHITLDPDQALADFNQALQLAPEKEKGAILKARAKLLETLGLAHEAVRDKIAAMETEGAYEGSAAFAALIGSDKDMAIRDAKSREQKELVKAHAAVGLGWCAKCKAAVELDGEMHCRLHPKARIRDIKLAVAEDVPQQLAVMQEALTKRNKAQRVRSIVYLVLAVLILVALCYLTNM